MINQSLTNFRNKCHKRNSKEKCLKSDNVNKFTSEALLKDESMNLANIEYFRLKEDIETFFGERKLSRDWGNMDGNKREHQPWMYKIDHLIDNEEKKMKLNETP